MHLGYQPHKKKHNHTNIYDRNKINKYIIISVPLKWDELNN